MIIIYSKDYFNPTDEDNLLELFSFSQIDSSTRLNDRSDNEVDYSNTLFKDVQIDSSTRLNDRSDNEMVNISLSVSFFSPQSIMECGSKITRLFYKINRVLYPKTKIQTMGMLRK